MEAVSRCARTAERKNGLGQLVPRADDAASPTLGAHRLARCAGHACGRSRGLPVRSRRAALAHSGRGGAGTVPRSRPCASYAQQHHHWRINSDVLVAVRKRCGRAVHRQAYGEGLCACVQVPACTGGHCAKAAFVRKTAPSDVRSLSAGFERPAKPAIRNGRRSPRE